ERVGRAEEVAAGPDMLRAVDLDELPATRPPRPRRIAAAGTLRPSPSARDPHPAAARARHLRTRPRGSPIHRPNRPARTPARGPRRIVSGGGAARPPARRRRTRDARRCRGCAALRDDPEPRRRWESYVRFSPDAFDTVLACVSDRQHADDKLVA